MSLSNLQRTHLSSILSSILPFCILLLSSPPLSHSAATATGLQSYHTEYVLYLNSPLEIGFSNCGTISIFKCVFKLEVGSNVHFKRCEEAKIVFFRE